MFESLRQRATWTPRRRRGAAVQLVLGGLFLMGVPALLGESAVGAGFRMLAPVAWLMAMAGTVLMFWPSGPRVRNPSAPEPSGLVPLKPRPAKAARADAPGAAAKRAAATPFKPAAPATTAKAPVAPKEHFRDTELQFDDPDSRH